MSRRLHVAHGGDGNSPTGGGAEKIGLVGSAGVGAGAVRRCVGGVGSAWLLVGRRLGDVAGDCACVGGWLFGELRCGVAGFCCSLGGVGDSASRCRRTAFRFGFGFVAGRVHSLGSINQSPVLPAACCDGAGDDSLGSTLSPVAGWGASAT